MNLMSIYSSLTGLNIQQVEEKFEGKGYGQFKEEVAEVIIETLKPIRDKYNDLMSNKDYIKQIYLGSAEKALNVSNKTLKKVYKKVGFVLKD